MARRDFTPDWKNVSSVTPAGTVATVSGAKMLAGALDNLKAPLDEANKTSLDNALSSQAGNTGAYIDKIRQGKDPKLEGFYSSGKISDARYQYMKDERANALRQAANARANAAAGRARRAASGRAAQNKKFMELLTAGNNPQVAKAVAEENPEPLVIPEPTLGGLEQYGLVPGKEGVIVDPMEVERNKQTQELLNPTGPLAPEYGKYAPLFGTEKQGYVPQFGEGNQGDPTAGIQLESFIKDGVIGNPTMSNEEANIFGTQVPREEQAELFKKLSTPEGIKFDNEELKQQTILDNVLSAQSAKVESEVAKGNMNKSDKELTKLEEMAIKGDEAKAKREKAAYEASPAGIIQRQKKKQAEFVAERDAINMHYDNMAAGAANITQLKQVEAMRSNKLKRLGKNYEAKNAMTPMETILYNNEVERQKNDAEYKKFTKKEDYKEEIAIKKAKVAHENKIKQSYAKNGVNGKNKISFLDVKKLFKDPDEADMGQLAKTVSAIQKRDDGSTTDDFMRFLSAENYIDYNDQLFGFQRTGIDTWTGTNLAKEYGKWAKDNIIQKNSYNRTVPKAKKKTINNNS